jgi:hypothetical protein
LRDCDSTTILPVKLLLLENEYLELDLSATGELRDNDPADVLRGKVGVGLKHDGDCISIILNTALWVEDN